MAAALAWVSASGSSTSMAEMPWGTVRVGTTTTSLPSMSPTHCWAAMMMFLLLGSTNTTSAGVRAISRQISSVEGFMVWPPEITPSTPRSLNTPAMPAPALTATTPYFFSGGATASPRPSSSASTCSRSSVDWAFLPAASSSAWVRMFSILASSRVPYFWASLRAAPGVSVWTWTLNESSSSPMTRLSPMPFR